MLDIEKDIIKAIHDFEGDVSLYAIDEYNNEVKINENKIVETASCIKLFILIEYYNQILKKEKSREDIIVYNAKKDYVENGSGIIQYLDGEVNFTSKNMATLMIIVSDNIATNKIIEYLGFEKINQTIKELGFNNTRLISKKLDFNQYQQVGETTALEYANAYKLLLSKKILTTDLCEEIIEILSKQNYNEMITGAISPKYIEEKGTENGFIKYIASKSGALGDEGRTDIIICRNDGGIISTKIGSYIVSVFIQNFSDHYFYKNNPATLLGVEINKLLFETFEKNNGSFK